VYWKVSLYDANGNRLYQLNSRGTDTVGKSDEIKIGSGTYYVKVEYEDTGTAVPTTALR